MQPVDGGYAFPRQQDEYGYGEFGMTLRDWFAGQALTNPAICTGTATEYDLRKWFGRDRTAISRAEIAAAQAFDYADAMLATRKETP